MTTIENDHETTTSSQTTLPEGSEAEKRYLLAASDALDRLFEAWVRAGRDPEDLAAELRIATTQSCLHARRKAEGAT